MSLALAGLMILVSGGLVYRHFANADSRVPEELLTDAANRSMSVSCARCGAAYEIPANQFMAKVAEGDSSRLVCEKCGAAEVWRAEAPFEYSDERWNAGWVGQDVQVSTLREWHHQHPEAEASGQIAAGEETH